MYKYHNWWNHTNAVIRKWSRIAAANRYCWVWCNSLAANCSWNIEWKWYSWWWTYLEWSNQIMCIGWSLNNAWWTKIISSWWISDIWDLTETDLACNTECTSNWFEQWVSVERNNSNIWCSCWGSCDAIPSSGWITVWVWKNYLTIQEAVDNSNTWWTVEIYPWTYNENVIIDWKDVSLIWMGNSSSDVLIIWNWAQSPILYQNYSGSTVTVENIKLQNIRSASWTLSLRFINYDYMIVNINNVEMLSDYGNSHNTWMTYSENSTLNLNNVTIWNWYNHLSFHICSWIILNQYKSYFVNNYIYTWWGWWYTLNSSDIVTTPTVWYWAN